ncbi:hypothetical protein BDZ97DRAFT_1680388 [Flammula alnicola]|nr:hypothetical protein BDZ97DRAFT_1680388 [Flammula alnicola]
MTIAPDHPQPECRIAEILQYTCELTTSRKGAPTFQCFPILRILKICTGQPAVEITKFVNVNVTNGQIEIPPGFKSDSIKGRPWREVVRYDGPEEFDEAQFPDQSIGSSDWHSSKSL